MNKLKIGFDPNGTWDRLDFRELIRELVLKPDEVEVFLVTRNPTNDPDYNSYVGKVQVEAGLDSAHVFIVPNNTTLISTLNNYGISIFFEASEPLVTEINSTIPFSVQANQLIGCVAILVNFIPDIRKLQSKFYTTFQFWINFINRSR